MATDSTAVQDAPTVDAQSDVSAAGPADAASSRAMVSVAGVVRGDRVSITNGLVGGVAGSAIQVERAFVRAALSAGDVSIHQAGAGFVLAGGSATIRQGGAQAIVATGAVTVEQGGSGIVLARNVTAGSGGTVVFGIAPRLEVADGGRVILGPLASLLLVGGAVAGVAGLVTVLRRSRSA